MSKKVYISPSDQVSNAYAWGNTNEHVQCQKIAEAEAAALRRSGVEVQVAARGSTMAQRCAQSNSFGADIHNCVHTNACNSHPRQGVRRLQGGVCGAGPAVPGHVRKRAEESQPLRGADSGGSHGVL